MPSYIENIFEELDDNNKEFDPDAYYEKNRLKSETEGSDI